MIYYIKVIINKKAGVKKNMVAIVKEKKLISLSKISPNTYNPQEMTNSKFKNLIANIRKHGFTDPIKVRPVLDVEKDKISTPYVIVDGEHRYKAFKEVFLEEDKIDCIITPMETLSDAMQATESANKIKGDSNPIKEAELYDYMIKDGITFEEIDELIGTDRDTIEAMIESLSIPDLPDEEIGFTGSDITEDSKVTNNVSEKIVMSFSIYPEQKKIINEAIKSIDKTLGTEMPEEDRRGEALHELSKLYFENN